MKNHKTNVVSPRQEHIGYICVLESASSTPWAWKLLTSPSYIFILYFVAHFSLYVFTWQYLLSHLLKIIYGCLSLPLHTTCSKHQLSCNIWAAQRSKHLAIFLSRQEPPTFRTNDLCTIQCIYIIWFHVCLDSWCSRCTISGIDSFLVKISESIVFLVVYNQKCVDVLIEQLATQIIVSICVFVCMSMIAGEKSPHQPAFPVSILFGRLFEFTCIKFS